MIEFTLPDARLSRKRLSTIRPSDIGRLFSGRHRQAATGILLALTFLLGAKLGYASPGSAEKAYKEGKFADAMTSYAEAAKKAPEESRLQFNLGTAAYKEKQYPKALKAFQAALNTEDLSLQNEAFYNMGNTLYREGQKSLKVQPPKTIERWEASLKAYDRALKLNPNDEDAQFNRELVKKKLEALKKQQKQNKKQNKNQSKNQKNNQNSKNQKGSGKSNKDKKNQEQSAQNKGDNSGKSKEQQAQNRKKNSKQHQNNQADAKKRTEKDKSPSDKADSKADIKPAGTPQSQQTKTSGEKTPEAARPGQMTREEAQRLMDALKGDEKRIPMMAGKKGDTRSWTTHNRRDW
jgi:Ca-activated chloride channel family protein